MIVSTFKKFDKDGDGFISKPELTRVLKAISKEQFNETEITALLNAADSNKDGRISYEEFVGWVTNDMDCAPLDKRAAGFKVDYRKLLPERFEVDNKGLNFQGRFKTEKAIGEGGFGKVFVARDAQMNNRMVAVKKVAIPDKKEEQDAIEQEIEAMKELDHPNICKLLGTFKEGKAVFHHGALRGWRAL
jgi:hypothetical protein